MLEKEMGHLDWSRNEAPSLHCLIRGLDPWPSAYGFLGDSRFRFFRPQVVPVAADQSQAERRQLAELQQTGQADLDRQRQALKQEAAQLAALEESSSQ